MKCDSSEQLENRTPDEAPNINKLLLARPRSSRYGSPMGAPNVLSDSFEDEPLHLQRLNFVDGDYGPDGTYWGGGQPIYVAFTPTLSTLIYVRAWTRENARLELLSEYPGITFIRGAMGR
jgi:hypothetical protein